MDATNRLWVIGFLSMLPTLTMQAEALRFEAIPKGNEVTFSAVGTPGFLHIEGKGASVTGHIEMEGEKWTGKWVCDLNAFTTDIDTRDKHMKEKYLQVPQFPTSTLEITKLTYKEKSNGSKLPFEGNLQLHGVTAPVKGTVSITYVNSLYQVEAEYSLTVDAFKIDIPSFAGITMAKDVTVHVKFMASSAPVH